MLIQWLTFAVMATAQIVGVILVLARVNYIVGEHSKEIGTLRRWRHTFGQKEMVYDALINDVADHDERIRRLESGGRPK